MTAPTRPAQHYCGACRYALERRREAGQPDRFVHTASYDNWDGPDHLPQPIPMAELIELHMVCDMCSHPNPVYAYRFANVVDTRLPGESHDLGEWWVICKPCSGPIERRDLAGMIERARRPFTERGEKPLMLAATLGPIYRQLLAHPWERLELREVRW